LLFSSQSAKKVPAKKDAAKIFSAKVYSTVEIICKQYLSHEQKEIAVGKLEVFSAALRLAEKDLV